MFCTAKHRPILKCEKNIALILMKTQATSSTFKLRVLPLEPANVFKGCFHHCASKKKIHFRFVVSSYLRLKYN